MFSSAAFVSIPSENTTSTDSSKLAGAFSLQMLSASDKFCLSVGMFFFTSLYFFSVFFHFSPFGASDLSLPNIMFYFSTVTPIDRAVPAIIFIAISISLAFKSSIFASAIPFS